MKSLLLISIALLAGCANQDQWTRDDTVWQGILVATMVADGIQTARIQDHPNIIEKGPVARAFLGQNPSTADVVMYMTTLSITHYLVARALPRGWRTIYQVSNIWFHADAVNRGHQLGLWSEPCTVNACE